jgi:hypothetical protein
MSKKLSFKDSGLTKFEWKKLKRLSSPAKIQDFLNTLKFNFEKRGETNRSVRETLKRGEAHCFEGALVAAAALWIAGRRPLLLDLVSTRDDLDHVVTLYKEGSRWGAISKTNHAVLRYREPVYRSVRELAMSYFHEYFLYDGTKTLRKFSEPFDLSKLGTFWINTDEDLSSLAYALDRSPHTRILSSKQLRKLRKADKIEIQAGKITEFKP